MAGRMVVRWGTRPRGRGQARSAAVQEPLFDIVVRPELRYYRQIMDALARSGFGGVASAVPGGVPAAGPDPLEAEQVVSKVLGTIWASQVRRDGDLEEAFGLGLVDFARQRHTPVSVALLRTLAVVAPIREVRVAAADAADTLVGGGLPESRWAPSVGRPRLGRCWAFEDVFGDQSTVICEFAYADGVHAMVVFVDHARLSVATDAMLTLEVEPLIRDMTNDAKNSQDMLTLRRVDPGWARAVLGRAFARTDLIDGVEVEPTYAELRAVAMARLDLLPEDPYAQGRTPPVPPGAAFLADEFLASPEARPLVAAGAVPFRLAEFFARYETLLVQIGPAKWDVFVDEWLAATWQPDPTERAALPTVARAWSDWAARTTNLPPAARAELAACLDETLPVVGVAPRCSLESGGLGSSRLLADD